MRTTMQTAVVLPPAPELKRKRRYLFLSVFSLLSGCLMYFFFRDTSRLLFFKWFEKLRVVPEPLKGSYSENRFFSFAVFHVPDVLWFLSGLFLIRFIWCADRKWCVRYGIAFYVLAIALECAQKPEWAPGTFDWLDIASLSAAAILEGIVYTFCNFTNRRKEE